jgi:hypothetical protein
MRDTFNTYYIALVQLTFYSDESIELFFTQSNDYNDRGKKLFYSDFILACLNTERIDIIYKYIPYMDRRLISYFPLMNYLKHCNKEEIKKEAVKKLLCFLPDNIIEQYNVQEWLH